MRLTQLEIKGFKSFADRTIININEDVTGIIGPNGCGKSNIVDAIRWVLGEQKSKALRLEKMTNIIFNGTKKRKQGGLAEVTMTFDNNKGIIPSEYSTVSITRVLYRTGESEYRLNGIKCRLKDITSLFMDTGIGSNSYAIIALGMVDDILHDRENSRRKLFEQAAGISKYKIRKRETLNKLKGTTADLDRVEDLVFEIENNLKILEKQAKRARKYFDLKIEYKEKSIEHAKYNIADFKDEYKDVQSKLTEQQDKLLGLNTAIKSLEAALESERKANIDKEHALTSNQRELNELVGRLRGMENDKQMAEQRLTFLRNNKKQIENRILSADSDLQKLQNEIEFYAKKVDEETHLENDAQKLIEEAKSNLEEIQSNHGSLKSELDVILKDQQQLEREVFELEKKKAVNQSQVENFKRDIVRSDEESEKRLAEVGDVKEKLDSIVEEKTNLETKIQDLESKEDARQVELKMVEEKVEQITDKVSKLNRKLDSKRNEYKLTKSLIDNLEGFPESIKFLSKNKNWAKKARLLSDLIYVKEDYRIAIENYLEPYLNYYVVKNLEEAYEAIQLLNKSQKGKAKFFLLDAFENTKSEMTLLPDTMKAMDLVECDKQYKGLVSHLLENVLLTDHDDIKSKIDEENITLISKSGKFIQKRFSVSGGSVGLFEGKKIGRKKNLEILSAAIKEGEKEGEILSKEFYEFKKKVQELKDADASQTIRMERRELERVSQIFVSLKTKAENFDIYLKEATDRKENLLRNISELENSIYDLDQQLNIKKAEADVANNKIQEADSTYRLAAEQLSEATGIFNQRNIENIRQQNKVNTFRKELEFRQKQLSDTQLKLFSDKDGIKEADDNLENVKQQIEDYTEQLSKLYVEKKEKQSALSEVERLYYDSRGGINEIENNIRKNNHDSRLTQQLLDNLKDKFNDVKLRMTTVGERLRAEFDIDINDIINQEPNPDLNPQELEAKVERLRKRLHNYGEINPMAVEAYDEIKIRYDNIIEQRNDILEAKESLEQTIKEIEDTATGKFLESFGKVRENFKKVFRSLFKEDDDCDLYLEDETDPLESNIKIMAKPKGKRPQSISQLSGGEKTLTATALLFSLYLLKPAPFCIFDEVDAPLDDANIDKFNNIIQEFSKDSQFIIVTHNKSTMAFMDVIYAVSMEDAASLVVPVDFRDFDHKTTTEVMSN